MFQKLLLTISILAFSYGISAQTETTTAPIIWQKYKISEQNVSLLFPKLPVLHKTGNECFDESTSEYFVYADGVVYGFNVTSKITPELKNNCANKKDFGKSNFTNRIEQLKRELQTTEAETLKQDNYELVKLTGKIKTYWLINDFKNKRWFEFLIIGADEKKKEVIDFISSLNLNENSQGIEIGNGSELSLGDENINTQTGKIGKTPLFIAFKRFPQYTDAAKQHQLQGTIKIEVTFLSNGTIGEISIIEGMKDDYLNEQVIKAIKGIVFIPEQKDGVPQTVTKKLFSSFILY